MPYVTSVERIAEARDGKPAGKLVEKLRRWCCRCWARFAAVCPRSTKTACGICPPNTWSNWPKPCCDSGHSRTCRIGLDLQHRMGGVSPPCSGRRTVAVRHSHGVSLGLSPAKPLGAYALSLYTSLSDEYREIPPACPADRSASNCRPRCRPPRLPGSAGADGCERRVARNRTIRRASRRDSGFGGVRAVAENRTIGRASRRICV